MPSEGDDPASYPYLQSLNPAQLKAVTAPPSQPLQILAGPGSGKTRVLTSRVAHLVKRHGYKPYEITAVTFTNKAANEMRKRLHVLLGPQEADQLVLGTFHATCVRYLRRYHERIGLPRAFVIADADDCKKIIARLLKARKEELVEKHITLKEGAVLSEISKAKAKGESPDGMAIRAARDQDASTSTLSIIAELYSEYQEDLRASNSLDFDDLLLQGLRLFEQEPEILRYCRHILVDEFQDTNTTQYQLMKCFATANGGVSVVGDPDQSIYGWRSAEIENLDKMTREFKDVEAIYLEENYRSTGSILSASHSIVSQDLNRIPKSLYTSHPTSTPVTLKLFSTPVIEASFISTEIKRLIAYSGNVLNYDDFAILLRYNALSRVIESALQKDAIPNRIIGGHKFFERMEVKDLLAYLQLADNPNYTPAFNRVVNVPSRTLGATSVESIVTAAKKRKVPPMELCESIIDGEKLPSDISSAIKNKLAPFVGLVRKLRREALKGASVGRLIQMVLDKTTYEDHLRKQQDFEQRWENVQELISYSVIVAEEQERRAEAGPELGSFAPASTVPLQPKPLPKEDEVRIHPMFSRNSESLTSGASSVEVVPKPKSRRKPRVKVEDDVIELLSSGDELDEVSRIPSNDNEDEMTPLRYFLQTSMLSTDTESSDSSAQGPKVTISTVHAAKGLEWPVVFIPAVEQGTFPSYRCTEEHEIAEERRLLYVAMTRAQSFLTLSHSMSRMTGGEDSDRDLSEFVAKSMRQNPNTFTSTIPTLDESVRKQISTMLVRPLPDEEITKELIMKQVRAAPPLSTWDAPDPRGSRRFARRDGHGSNTRGFDYWASDVDDYKPGPGGTAGTFTSARAFAPKTAPAQPKPPVVKLASSNRNLPAPLPFSFNGHSESRPDASLNSFTSSSSSSLAFMKNLGIPDSSGTSGQRGRPSNSVPEFTSPGFSVAAMARREPLDGAIPLAKGTKRALGMRGVGVRPPQADKRPKLE